MKITKIFFVVFLLTFLLGNVSVLILKQTELQHISLPVYETNSTKTYIETTKPISITETKFEPEIFDVPDFSEEETPDYKIQLLEVGDGHRKEDVKAKSGETWLGFYESEKGNFLRFDKIKVYRTKKSDYIEDSKTVEVKSEATPIVLIKNAKSIREGKVKTLFSLSPRERSGNPKEDDSLLTRRFVKEFKLGERKYILRVKQAIDNENGKFLALVLETENNSQIIRYCPYLEEDDYLGNLVWAGDLDRDGNLDLYMEYNTHERGYMTILFLSSEAEKGKFLKEVDIYSTTGC